jgi:lipoprotein NlpI
VKAVADYSESIRLDPSSASALVNRGNARRSLKQQDLALADFDRAIRLDPNGALTFNNRGMVWQDQKEYAKAVADFSRAIELDPGLAVAFNNRGMAWRHLGEYRKAVADHDAASRLEPATAQHGSLGLELFYTGDFEPSSRAYRQAVVAAPQNAYAKIWLYLASSRTADRAAARSVLEADDARLTDRAWPAPVVDLFLGRVDAAALRRAARGPDAKTAAERACEADFYIGERALLNGDAGQARRLFQSAIDTCPHNFDEYHGALAEASRLR